jgi:hypothetical protein
VACVVRQCCDACLTLLVRLPYDLEHGMELLTFYLNRLAWTARAEIHWIVPLLSCVPLGMSILCILVSLLR